MHTSTPRPSRRLARGRARVLLAQMHGLRAEGLGHRQPLGDRVDRDHVRRAGGPARPAPRTGPPARGRAPRPRRPRAGRCRRPRGSRCPSRRRRTAPTSSLIPAGTLRRTRSALGTSARSACVPCSEPSAAPWPNVREAVALVKPARGGRTSSVRRRSESSRARDRRRSRRERPSPTASTVPTYSWPIVKPGSICTRPW